MRRPARARLSSTLRALAPAVVRLEARELLTAAATPDLVGFTARPMYELSPLVSNPTPPSSALTPAKVRAAYGFDKISFGGVVGDGSGQTIAIVDAYDSPTAQADLDVFSDQFGLPRTAISRVNQSGGTAYPATDTSGGWETETALDVEWAHAVAPGAKILLVEANSNGGDDLLAAVDYAAAHAGVVSMSWGGGEFSGQNTSSVDGHFIHAGTTFVASSGDYGAPISWPSASPNVLAVGGTRLSVGTGGAYVSESGWSGSGGGPSAYFARPTYQNGVVTQTTMRANPDVAYDADPNSGFAIYNSFSNVGWSQVGGTSAGAPQWAALVAIADQGRALNGKAALNAAGSQELMTTLYANATSGIFHDVTTGTSTGTPNYAAAAGYDYVTGIGTPYADKVVTTLVGPTAPTPDTLTVSAPSSSVAGRSFTVTVGARNSSGAVDAAYRGTVHFASADTQAGLPADYTFTAADAGSHTFTVTLKTAGSESLTVTDTTTGAARGQATVAVSPAAASQLVLVGLPTSATAGTASSFTVTAKDAYGNVATGYTGTVRFSSSDAAASLPASYTFTAADAGSHAFSVTFGTAGTQSLTVSDTVTAGLTATQGGISVSPAAAAISLTATTVSSSKIDLTWTALAGAGGYWIDRSTGSGSWLHIANTSASTTSFHDALLASGTAYSYRVRAFLSGGQYSAYSNVATATTSVATPGVVGLWVGESTSPNVHSASTSAPRPAVVAAAPAVTVASSTRRVVAQPQADATTRWVWRRTPGVVAV